MTEIYWFLLKFEDLLLVFVTYDGKVNMFGLK